MVEESAATRKSKVKSQKSKVDEDYSVLVEEVVKSRIIENWESQDDPEHLRTIRDRILSNEQRAGYLLELYQQIQQQGEVAASNRVEFSELRLSGLVVQREGKLRVYNRIYQQVFNQSWVETQLKNLRPYSQAFRAWVASGYSDESRLLQGKTLESAEKWAKGKNLSYQDRQFLAASREKEIAVRNKEAELERERKDREAAEQRNQVLSEANVKAKRRIRNGTVVLVLAVLGAVGLGIFAAIEGNKAFEARKNAQDAKQQVITANRKVKDANTTVEQERKNVIALQNEAKRVEKKFKDLEQQAQQATKKAEAEQLKAEQAERKARNANLQAKKARKQAEQAQQSANNASQKAIDAEKQAKAEQRKAEQAKKIADDAKNEAQLAKKEAESLQNQLASVKKDIEIVKKDVDTVQQLSKLAGELRNENLTTDSDEALRQAGLSFRVEDHNLKQAMLLASMSQAYQKLKKPDKAKQKIDESLNYLNNKGNKISSDEGLQIKVLVKRNEGNLLAEKSPQQAIKAYQQAYEILKKHPTETNPFVKDKILVANDIELVHRGLLKLQANRNQEVWNSLKEHFYAELESFLNREKPDWRAADRRTWRLMLFIANREEERYLDIPQFENFSCPDLKRMDELWVKNSRGNFGFSVQKKIWVKTGNRLGIKPGDWNDSDTQNYYKFISAVGWYNDKKYNAGRGSWVSYSDIIGRINKDPISPRVRGGLPGSISVTLSGLRLRRVLGAGGTGFFSRVATCKL